MKLELTTEETQLVLDSLLELPAKHSFHLILKIQQQAQIQLAPKPPKIRKKKEEIKKEEGPTSVE